MFEKNYQEILETTFKEKHGSLNQTEMVMLSMIADQMETYSSLTEKINNPAEDMVKITTYINTRVTVLKAIFSLLKEIKLVFKGAVNTEDGKDPFFEKHIRK